MNRLIILTAVLVSTAGTVGAQSAQPVTKAMVYGQPAEITAERVTKCQRNLKKSSSHTRDVEVRAKQHIVPVTTKFIALDFPEKETLAFCASLKAGEWKEFMPLNLVYVTNYKHYGTYSPERGLQVSF